MNDLLNLTRDYQDALRDYVFGAGEEGLVLAYELGRRALDTGRGVLDMGVVQQDALAEVLREMRSPDDVVHTVSAAKLFFVESLSPFEMAHRGFGEANTALRSLNERLEDEARRIAHRLHDDVGQLIAVIHLALDEALLGLPGPARDRFRKVRELLVEMNEQVRGLSHELRPLILDDLGLVPALEALCTGVAKRTKLDVQLQATSSPRLDSRVETAIYRAAQEALSNASKHARASHVVVRLEHQKERIACSVTDDGAGFDPEGMPGSGSSGLGLIGIRERLQPMEGTLEVRSAPGEGTEVAVTIPLEP